MYIKKASASKINSYYECNLKYKFRYVDGLYESYNKTANTDPLHFGSYIHRIFELGYNASNLQDLQLLAEAERQNYSFDEKLDQKVPNILENFLEFNSQLKGHISAEMVFDVEVTKDFSVNGIIDRVLKSSSGKFLVIDYKTSKRPKTKKDLYNDRQMKLYCYAIHKMYDVPVADITLAHYYPHITKGGKLVSISYTSSQIFLFMKDIVKTAWDIRKKKKHQFPAMMNQFCNWCSYKELCPKFGGTEEALNKAIANEKILKEARKKG